MLLVIAEQWLNFTSLRQQQLRILVFSPIKSTHNLVDTIIILAQTCERTNMYGYIRVSSSMYGHKRVVSNHNTKSRVATCRHAVPDVSEGSVHRYRKNRGCGG